MAVARLERVDWTASTRTEGLGALAQPVRSERPEIAMLNSGRPQASTVGEWMVVSPHVIEHDATLGDAARMMAEHAVRHLPVVRGGRPVGVLSDRDVAAVQALSLGAADRVRVEEAMTPVPYAVPPGMPLQRVAKMMARHRYGCALVTDENDQRVLGVFTLTDALRALAALLDPPK